MSVLTQVCVNTVATAGRKKLKGAGSSGHSNPLTASMHRTQNTSTSPDMYKHSNHIYVKCERFFPFSSFIKSVALPRVSVRDPEENEEDKFEVGSPAKATVQEFGW
jgi:hypothetical protein